METPMATDRTRLIAGVSVPDSPLITDVLDYAEKLSEPYLFNHAVRSWLFAAKIGETKAIDCDLEVVAVGTILHDIGLTAGVSGSHRFEVNGAIAVVHQGPRSLGSPRTREGIAKSEKENHHEEDCTAAYGCRSVHDERRR
jgi:hypothetical protein